MHKSLGTERTLEASGIAKTNRDSCIKCTPRARVVDSNTQQFEITKHTSNFDRWRLERFCMYSYTRRLIDTPPPAQIPPPVIMTTTSSAAGDRIRKLRVPCPWNYWYLFVIIGVVGCRSKAEAGTQWLIHVQRIGDIVPAEKYSWGGQGGGGVVIMFCMR